MDVSVREEIDKLAAKLKGMPIDVVINKAAIWSDRDRNGPGRARRAVVRHTLDYDQFELFMAHQRRGSDQSRGKRHRQRQGRARKRKLINISSLGRQQALRARKPDQLFWYRASKAALNNVMRSLTTEVEHDGVIVLLFHPGRRADGAARGSRLHDLDARARGEHR